MDIHERSQMLAELKGLCKSQPSLPWWLKDIIRILDDVAADTVDLGQGQDQLEEVQVAQQKAINGIRDQYSEVLYKLKSGD